MGNVPSNQSLPQNSSSIEKQASAATAQVNALIAQSNEQLMCGPACQKEKNISNLQENYVKAQTNLKTAPQQLEQAKQNYYKALEGQAAYNKMVLDKVTEDAKKVTSSLKTKFDTSSIEVGNLIGVYNTLKSNFDNVNDLSQEYAQENAKMAKTLKKIRGDIITNDRKTYYEQQSIDGLSWWYNWFRIIYIVLVIGFIILLLFKSHWWFYKILIILVVLFYPVYIAPLVVYILKCIQNLGTLILPKDVYLTL
jgi:hypothetical protein